MRLPPWHGKSDLVAGFFLDQRKAVNHLSCLNWLLQDRWPTTRNSDIRRDSPGHGV